MPINYVHDEIIYDVDPSISREKIQDVQRIMQEADQISVAMKSDAEIGRRWGDCRKTSEVVDFMQLIEDEDGDGGSILEDLEEGDEAMNDNPIYIRCSCGHEGLIDTFASSNPDEIKCPNCEKVGTDKDFTVYTIAPEKAQEDMDFIKKSGMQFAKCKCGAVIEDLVPLYARTILAENNTPEHWYAHSCGHKFNIHTVELGAGSIKGKPVGDDSPDVTDYDRYYFHPESDNAFIIKAGEALPKDADFALCNELTKDEYDAIATQMAALEAKPAQEPAPTQEPTPAKEEPTVAETQTKGLGAAAPKPPVEGWTVEQGKKLIKEQLDKMENIRIRMVVAHMIGQLPEYFWHIPASSSGKYHPALSLGEGGLVRHVIAGVRVFEDLVSNESVVAAFFPEGLTQDKIDVMRGALLLHDGKKQGDAGGQHTVFEHPNLIRELTLKIDPAVLAPLTAEDKANLGIMMGCIEAHMGQWNTDKRSPGVVLKKPANQYERFVHMMDYISSRKYIALEY